MRSFDQAFPQIASRGTQLSWSHYRVLARVTNPNDRRVLTNEAMEKGWLAHDLEKWVRNRRWKKQTAEAGGKSVAHLPVVCLGPFYTYRVVDSKTLHSRAAGLLIDLGFSHFVELGRVSRRHFEEGAIVESVKDRNGHYSLRVYRHSDPAKAGEESQDGDPSASPQDDESVQHVLYTYKAYVERAIDGDTLKVEFDLGFGNWQRETIRLRSIDCPEMDTPEGRAAKRFVEAQIEKADYVMVKSIQTKKEKWGRYLGDVFLSRGNQPPVYLNQLLLDHGHAVRVRG